MKDIRRIVQDPNDNKSHLYRFINYHLGQKDLRRLRIAMAYVSWGGLSLIANALEWHLDEGRALETIFGIGNGVTTLDALWYSDYLRSRFSTYSVAAGFQWDYADSEFHSKFLEFEYSNHLVIIVGSANLTNGGLAFNHELSLAVTVGKNDAASTKLREWWSSYLRAANELNPRMIRQLTHGKKLGREGQTGGSSGQLLGLNLPRAKKPLFAHILEGGSSRRHKHETLAETSTLSEKPDRLYLEILGETGGGPQVQLPVATLSTFFGVGSGEQRDVTFLFQATDPVEVQLTHFGNNTHRVRLRPIKEVPRPSVLVFDRTQEDDVYECQVVPQPQYRRVLRTKCREQTREGSRRWGFE